MPFFKKGEPKKKKRIENFDALQKMNLHESRLHKGGIAAQG
jgi:hypothetical protein